MRKIEIILTIALGLAAGTSLVIVMIMVLVYFFPDLIISTAPPASKP